AGPGSDRHSAGGNGRRPGGAAGPAGGTAGVGSDRPHAARAGVRGEARPGPGDASAEVEEGTRADRLDEGRRAGLPPGAGEGAVAESIPLAAPTGTTAAAGDREQGGRVQRLPSRE